MKRAGYASLLPKSKEINMIIKNIFNGKIILENDLADLRGANLPIYQLCPEGNLIVYKKASGMIVQLELLKDVKRTSSLVGRKCRAESAIVKAIYNPDRTISDLKEVTGDYNSSILYKVGETVLPDKYNDDIRVENTNGIHFFITFEEARDC